MRASIEITLCCYKPNSFEPCPCCSCSLSLPFPRSTPQATHNTRTDTPTTTSTKATTTMTTTKENYRNTFPPVPSASIGKTNKNTHKCFKNVKRIWILYPGYIIHLELFQMFAQRSVISDIFMSIKECICFKCSSCVRVYVQKYIYKCVDRCLIVLLALYM